MNPTALALALLLPGPARPGDDGDGPSVIEVREALALPPAGRVGRVAVPVDPVAAAIAAGRFEAPKEGDAFERPGGAPLRWSRIEAGEDGQFRSRALAGGYAAVVVPSDSERVMVLEAAGHGVAYVNGEPRAGDPYGYGFVRLPVGLRRGENLLLFGGGRGTLRVRLTEPTGPAELDAADATLPDLVAGAGGEAWAALVVRNATGEALRGWELRASLDGGGPVATPVPSVPPLSVRKAGFRVAADPSAGPGERPLRVALHDASGAERAVESSIRLRVVPPEAKRKVTFVSAIDGGVQYYGLVPASAGSEGRPGLILTLHGASVEAIGQANVYAPKAFAHVVAPTNRRPYGFDWEDWGRLDALEVLDLAARDLGTDPARTWLTGHSMGGHGTWHLGVTFPDRFAAIAPSAGWVSMASYAGAVAESGDDPVAAILRRAARPSDTLALAENLKAQGVYVLHGDADDNVPVAQARTMRGRLGEFHPDFAYYERPGAGHWWGDACCDWPPLMEFLRTRILPAASEVRRIDFTTADPGLSAHCHWATVESQRRRLELSRVRLEVDPDSRTIRGTTENIARLALDLRHLNPDGPLRLELDGDALRVEPASLADGPLRLARSDDGWSVADPLPPSWKNPARSGPFKDAFRHRMIFVYGTRGDEDEDAWALAKARFDAETFWYRGNGSVDVVADVEFDPAEAPDRGVVLYGNADTNGAWAALLGEGPVQVRRGEVEAGGRVLRGEGLTCLLVRPRPGSDVACVAAVSGTGPTGFRGADRLPYFVSGVAYPDVTILGPEASRDGRAAVLGAGFFGPSWGLDDGEFAWRDPE